MLANNTTNRPSKGHVSVAVAIMIALAIAMALAGCNQKSEASEIQEGDAKTTTESSVSTDKSASKDKTPVQSTSQELDAWDVENNGTAYVRVGNRVYFREYGPDSLITVAMFGRFSDAWSESGSESSIAYIDLDDGTVNTAFASNSYGNLYVANGEFYLQERVDGVDTVVRRSLDGNMLEVVREGKLLGVTDGGLVAIEQSDVDASHREHRFYLHLDGKEVASYQSQTNLIFAGLLDSGLFLLEQESSGTGASTKDSYTLWQLEPDGDGSLLRFGELDAQDKFHWSSAEPESFVSSGDQIGLVVGNYEGTGHFLSNAIIVTAVSGKEGSLSVVDVDAGVDEKAEGYLESAAFCPKLTVTESGSIEAVPHLPREAQVFWRKANDKSVQMIGDLRIYDGTSWQTSCPGFMSYDTDDDNRSFVQHLESVGTTVYATLADARANPSENVGWRNAYSLLSTSYLSVSEQGNCQELARVDCSSIQ